MSERTYSARIINASKEFTKREQLMIIDSSNYVGIDGESISRAEAGVDFIIKPAAWAIIEIHNEKSENKDYNIFVILDADGTMYCTSSENFQNSYFDIASVMGDEEFELAIKRIPSKNYKGKEFITCSIC